MSELQKLEVGTTAPAFTVLDQDGKSVSLADFKGKTVVLEWHNFGCPFVRKHYNSGAMQALQWTLSYPERIRHALVIGHGAHQLRQALPEAALITRCDLVAAPGVDIVADEDRLPVADGRFDLILACGTLDNLDDLPGALTLIRRALRPGGLLALTEVDDVVSVRICVARGSSGLFS